VEDGTELDDRVEGDGSLYIMSAAPQVSLPHFLLSNTQGISMEHVLLKIKLLRHHVGQPNHHFEILLDSFQLADRESTN
jgi:hypothetical protein